MKQLVEVILGVVSGQLVGHYFHLIENRKQTELLRQLVENTNKEVEKG